jgi:FkbM family methyltransferase
MGMISSRVNALIRNARLAYDDVRQTFYDNFMPGAELTKVPAGRFHNGIAVITPNEVSDRHGTGVILRRCFGRTPGILSIRSTNLHGEHHFGDFSVRFGQGDLSRFDFYERLIALLRGNTFSHAICVPYLADELLTSIALKELFGLKLCVYLMDDNYLVTKRIPEPLMREALEKADLRLAISPEMREGYENKFRLKFWLRPPVVTPESISSQARIPSGESLASRRGIVVGSLWSAQALRWLAETVSASGLQVDWYGNSDASWLNVDANQLSRQGIRVCGFVEESRLAEIIRQYPYAVVPSGTLAHDDSRIEIARYSLPTRMPFLLAIGNIPTIVLGSPLTAAGRFVERFKFGQVAPYNGQALRAAVERICSPDIQRQMREAAAAAAPKFSSEGAGKWILDSMDSGEPVSKEMEEAIPRQPGDSAIYIRSKVPADILPDFADLYRGMERMKHEGFNPDFVVDVGASTGVWSETVCRIFPDARFLLFEPLYSRYVQRLAYLRKVSPPGEVFEVALGTEPGKVKFRVSSDLYGSTVLEPEDSRGYQEISVPMTTLDEIQAEWKVQGRGLLKLDVQGAEHLVLAGAKSFLSQVDVLIIELSLFSLTPGALGMEEMLPLLTEHGFEYYDDVGEWRSPADGRLLQKDVTFVRRGLVPHRPE